MTIVGARVVDKLLGTINSRYTRAGDLCEFESELARSAASSRICTSRLRPCSADRRILDTIALARRCSRALCAMFN